MMANELQTKLDAILLDKNTNLLPENLKKGTTLLGIEGTFVEPIKLLSTTEELSGLENPELNDKAMVCDDGVFGGIYEYRPYQDLDTISIPYMTDASYISGETTCSVTKNTNTRRYDKKKILSLLKKILVESNSGLGSMMIYEVNGELEAAYMSRVYNNNTYYVDDPRAVIQNGKFVTNRISSSINYGSLHPHTLYRCTLNLEAQTYTKTTVTTTAGSHGKGYYFTVSGLNTIPMYVKVDYGEFVIYPPINYDTDKYITVSLPTDSDSIYSPEIIGWTYLNTQLTSDIKPNNILKNMTIYGDNGIITGTMKDNGELEFEADEVEQRIPQGYIEKGTIKPAIIGAKLFENKSELEKNNDSIFMDDRFGIVYGKSYTSYQPGDIVTKMDFAKTITLDKAVTKSHEGMVVYGDIELAPMVNFYIELTPYSCKMYRDAVSYYTNTLFEYTSEDGLTYVRTTTSDTFTLGIGDTHPWTAEYDDVIANFVRVGEYEFNGVYKWTQDTTKLPLYKYPTLQDDGTFKIEIAKNNTSLNEPLDILINNAMPTMNIRTSMTYVPFIVIRKSDTIYQFHYYCTKALSETDRYIYRMDMLYDINGYHAGGYASSYSSAGWHYVEVNTQTKTYSHNTCSHTEGYNINLHYGYTLLETDMWASVQINQSAKTASKVSIQFYNLTTASTPTLPYGKKWSVAETQLTATASDVASGKIAYGENGVITGTAEIVNTSTIMELGKTYIVEFKQNIDESINVAEQMAGNAIKVNGFDGIYLMLGEGGFNAGYHNIMYEGETEAITLIRGYMDQSTIDLVKSSFGEDNVIIDDTTRGWKQICGGTTTTIRIESTGYINPIMIRPGQFFYNGETVTSGVIDLSSYSWLIESIKEI